MGEKDNEQGVKGERKEAQGSKIRIERKLCDLNMSPPPSPSSLCLLFSEFVLLLAGKTLRRHPEPVFNKGGHLILGRERRQPGKHLAAFNQRGSAGHPSNNGKRRWCQRKTV